MSTRGGADRGKEGRGDIKARHKFAGTGLHNAGKVDPEEKFMDEIIREMHAGSQETTQRKDKRRKGASEKHFEKRWQCHFVYGPNPFDSQE